MNKAELIELMVDSKSSAFNSRSEAERALNAVLEAIGEGLEKTNSVQLVGFGTFEVKTRAARKGRNPKTGEEIDIPASKTVGFKVGSKLKNRI